MELCVRLVTRPRPGLRTKVVVLVIIIVAVLTVWGTGQEPVMAVSLVLGAGLAGARVARALTARASVWPPRGKPWTPDRNS